MLQSSNCHLPSTMGRSLGGGGGSSGGASPLYSHLGGMPPALSPDDIDVIVFGSKDTTESSQELGTVIPSALGVSAQVPPSSHSKILLSPFSL